MSKKIEGKISNQGVTVKLSNKCVCGKCSKLIDPPSRSRIFTGSHYFSVMHYLENNFYIYETNKGKSIVYCSDYCRRKHNHRFRR